VGIFFAFPIDNPVTTLLHYSRKEVRLAFREAPPYDLQLETLIQETFMSSGNSVGPRPGRGSRKENETRAERLIITPVTIFRINTSKSGDSKAT